jgi:trimethylamine--corrinoid protein Co-methyltransferase
MNGGCPSVPIEDLQRIHETALRVLAEIGVRTDHAEMRDRLAGLGCRVAGERIFMPSDVVTATLARIPRAFDLHGRDVTQQIMVAPGAVHCTNTGIFANITDLDTGQVRRSTLADVEATTRLLDAVDQIDAVYVSLVDATELEPHMVTVSDFAATLANTTKPLIGPGLANRSEAEAVVAMARALRQGHDEALRRFPVCVPFVCSISPLYFPKDVVDALIVVSEAGLPLDVLSNPVMGLTSPYTIAGTVALGHAEVLAFAVMAQVVTPGLPLLTQNTPSVADMRSLASTTGGPETGLIRGTAMALSSWLELPGCAHGHSSAARLDFQAGEEKTWNGLLIALARPAVLGGLGGLANVTLTAYEAIVLDNERYGTFRRILDGVKADADHLAFDVIAAVAEGGSAVSHEHTLHYLHSDEVWMSRLAIRRGLVDGLPSTETSLDRARSEARRLLETHRVEPLPQEVRSEIGGILAAHRERKVTH